MADINSVVTKVIEIPIDFKKGDKSMYTLVIDSGYPEVYEHVLEGIIEQALENKPDLINEWIILSENQRIPEGYYLRNEGEKFIVSYFSTKDGYKEAKTEYPSIGKACSAFIKHKIEFCRQLPTTGKKKN
jgi:hypothetical protein